MPGKISELTPLAARKEQLLMESDRNRHRLTAAVRDWQAGFEHARHELHGFVSVATTTARLAGAATLAARLFRRRPREDGHRSWLSILASGFATGTTLWSMFNSKRRPEN